ncbi:hypothetical protein CLV28_0727 [Sediminihabitans luteus]|uniref:Uncharacterized protein n=1 Tax=Sediminihabitans luteus TaxID=1138585 RepID=A0A2M9D034_9CELL|nr:hypothetical protein [Sediminihabitans luteus]PJJ77507.1 hypothetical protein CLV28_0727 [Sediminihabitans luteus]
MSEYRFSRCTESANAPQRLHWAVIGGDPRFVFNELATAIKAQVHPNALIDAIADLRAVLERIEQCAAVDPSDIKNITRNRDLWEMRFHLDTWGLIIRIYETEVRELPAHIVLLHAHQKVVDVRPEEIADLQNEQIDVATARWIEGRPSAWGLV